VASVTATHFKNVMNVDTSTTNLEYVLDLAIDSLNIFGAELSNMSGTAGSKTVTLTSKQRGGVFIIAREIYQKFYKDAGSHATISGLSLSASDLLTDDAFYGLCEKIGHKLASTSEGIAFTVTEDTSGIDYEA
jgi:hypothetical protein